MGKWYTYVLEAQYKDKWVNIDHWCRRADGTLRHQYLLAVSERDAFSCDYDELAHIKGRLQFSELAETTQEMLRNQFHYMGAGFCDSIDAFIWGNLDELEQLLDKPVEYPSDFAINRKQLQNAVTIAKEALLQFMRSIPYEEGMQYSKPIDIHTRIVLIED